MASPLQLEPGEPHLGSADSAPEALGVYVCLRADRADNHGIGPELGRRYHAMGCAGRCTVKGFWGEAAGLRYVQVEPEPAAADLPLIIAMHGRGADATDLAPLAAEFGGDGYRWLFPQGPRPLPLAPALVGWAWYELGQRQAETGVESHDLLALFLGHMLGQISVPRKRALLMGFSQGAVMALHLGLTSEEPFAGVVAMSGHLPAAEAFTPLLPDRRDRNVLIVHGTDDQTLPVELGRRTRAALEEAGLHPEYAEFPMGHQITAESLAAVREFVHRVLPPGVI